VSCSESTIISISLIALTLQVALVSSVVGVVLVAGVHEFAGIDNGNKNKRKKTIAQDCNASGVSFLLTNHLSVIHKLNANQCKTSNGSSSKLHL
jgi:hypothetical protein